MGTNGQKRLCDQGLGLFVILAVALFSPISASAAAADPLENLPRAESSAAAIWSSSSAEETAHAHPVRTMGLLASVVAATGLVAVLWWTLVIRRRD